MKCTAIRHVHFEDLGAFEAVLRERGFDVSYLDVGIDPIPPSVADSADLLVVLGGPIGAYEEEIYPLLRAELALIERRLSRSAPLLGICLGAQLMARVLGAPVYPGSAKEIGWAPIQLTNEGRSGPMRLLDDVPVLHWHGDTFDLPDGAVRLASTPLYPNQAFSRGANTLAVQFHPEAMERGFERWLLGHTAEINATAGVSVPALRSQAKLLAAKSAAQGQSFIAEWLALLTVQDT